MTGLGQRISAAMLAAGMAIGGGAATAADENVMVVFDGSNSMWGQIDGTAKIEIARGVMQNLLGSWTDDREVGLMAYGHRRRGDCTDIELLVAPGAGARDDILSRINAITPTGKTPLTDAVEQAAKQLSYTDKPATVVLISDGLESCDRDPCALAEALEKGGVGFTAHVVGFGLGGDADAASLACIAEKTGGQYIQANNAAELGKALSAVGTAVAEAEPEPEPEPAAPQVTVQGPATAVAGSDITVTWSPTVAEADYIVVVPAGSEEDESGSYVRIGKAEEVTLPVPGDEGLYEVRYLHNATRTVLGHDPLEATKPEVALSAPDSALTGSDIDVAWTPTINRRDYVTIVPAGSDEDTFGDYQAVSKNSEATLTAPADPGLYEVRYILNIDKSTVASRPLEVTDPQVVLQVPKTTLTGARFDISWGGTVNEQDYITIVPAGTDEGEYGNYIVVRDKSKGELSAPADTGMYEVRYVLREGARTLASEMIEVTEPEVTVSGPESTATGSKFEVSWTGTVNANDYVTIVPVGADEGTHGSYVVVRDKAGADLNAPADPGMYELRYILREGTKTLATAMIEVTEPTVTVSGPDSAVTGSKFEVSWTGTVNANDYVTIVPVGADEGEHGSYVVVRDKAGADLNAPADPGMYELRYILREGTKTLATAMIEITEPTVTVTAPETALAGSKFDVSWTGAVNRNDYVTIVPVGTDEGEHGNYVVVRDETTKSLTAPSDTGMYEVRYILREGTKTLATAMIEITEPEVTVTAPASALAGSKIEISWTGTVAKNDYVTIVPVGTDEGEYGQYFQVRDRSEKDLQMPADPGMYEVRYVLREGARTMASTMIEITEPEVTVTGPSEVRAGDALPVSWTGAVSDSDYITVVPMGAADDQFGDYFQVRGKTEGDLTAPDQTGMYELRYVLREGNKVLARQMVEVLAEDAALDTGASLSAPDTAAPGSTIEVGWSVASDSADQRITLARAEQAIFTWLAAVKITGDPPVRITLPDEAGVYELRFLDVAGQAVLSRKVIKVE